VSAAALAGKSSGPDGIYLAPRPTTHRSPCPVTIWKQTVPQQELRAYETIDVTKGNWLGATAAIFLEDLTLIDARCRNESA